MSEAQFAPGDRVRCLRSTNTAEDRGGIVAGRIYTVRKIDFEGYPILTHELAEQPYGWSPDRFELHAKAGTFVAGDKVVCLESFSGQFTVGRVYAVNRTHPDADRVSVERDDVGDENGWLARHFRLATSEEIAKAEVRFKAGDKVICTNGIAKTTTGSLYTVERANEDVLHLQGVHGTRLASRFRLATAEEIAAAESFKVGDRVRSKANKAWSGEMVVTELRQEANAIICRHPKLGTGGFAISDLEPFVAEADVNTTGRTISPTVPFVVGDVVECVRESGRRGKIGERYAVTDLTNPRNPSADLMDKEGHLGDQSRFRLAIPAGGFRAGDLVECVQELPVETRALTIGKRYILREGDIETGCHAGAPMFTDDDGFRRYASSHAVNVLASFRLISRPDADGWHAWAGGENPVPGMRVEIRLRSGTELPGASEQCFWGEMRNGTIVAFRIVEAAPSAAPQQEEPAKLDPSSIKIGDEVIVRMKVTRLVDSDGDFRGDIVDGEGFCFFRGSSIADHTSAAPKPLEVGEAVEGIDGGRGIIRLIEGGEAAVYSETSGLTVHSLDELDRAA